jgi:hypothetical protein
MTCAHQILAGVLHAAHDVTEALIGLAGHERERQLARREEPDQALRVTTVGLHPIARGPRDRPGRHHGDVESALLAHPREDEARRARLIDRAQRTIELLQEHRHDALGLTAQTLH